MNRKTVYTLLAGLCLAMAVVTFCMEWEIPLYQGVLALLIFLGVFSFAVQVFFFRRATVFQDKMTQAISAFMESCDTQTYFRTMNDLMREEKNAPYRNVLKINISMGYSYYGDFQKANALLEEVVALPMAPITQAIVWNNMASNDFCMGEISKGCAIMTEQEDLLNQYRKEPSCGSGIAQTFAMWHFALGETEKGKAALAEAMETAEYEADRDLCHLMEAEQEILAGNTEQAKTVLESLFKTPIMAYAAEKRDRLYQLLE